MGGRFVIRHASADEAASRALCADGLCHYHRFLPHTTGRGIGARPPRTRTPTPIGDAFAELRNPTLQSSIRAQTRFILTSALFRFQLLNVDPC